MLMLIINRIRMVLGLMIDWNLEKMKLGMS